MLQIYNSLTRRKEPFQPLEPKHVRMYVCGMTVYDYCHLGHARVLVVFDTVYRYLRQLGYRVTYVRNITDVDDKIIARAQANGESTADLTARFIAAMHEDATALGVLPPTHEPRATEHIPAIQGMVNTLMAKGHAYPADNGDIYYSVASFPAYGRLSGKKPDELRAGARIEVDEAKRDPLDFTLWKAAKPEEPAWQTPWGETGRPGWHIECSAMATELLGAHFDIHGGGQDLQFPHHENEIAQSEACTGEPFVNYWMHNGFVRVNEEKMSKSLGNFFTVREILQHYRPEEVRYFILTSHYRSPLNFSDQQLTEARAALTRLYTALRGLPEASGEATEVSAPYRERFHTAMQDDFNTPEALAVLFDLAHALNKARADQAASVAELAMTLRELGEGLGLLTDAPERYLKGGGSAAGENDTARIDKRVAERQAARKARDFATADRIRDELLAEGIVLEDGPAGTTWRRTG